MTTQKTALEGSPASLYAVASYLRDTFAAQTTTLADAVYTARTDTWDAWECGAADQLFTRLGGVGAGADQLATFANAAATAVETLAGALVSAQNRLADARQTATDAGLRVVGTVIYQPLETMNRTSADVAKATAWSSAVTKAGDGYQLWYDAVDTFGSSWEQNQPNILTAATGAFQGAAAGISVFNQAYRLTSAFNTSYQIAANHLDVDTRALDDIVKDGHLRPTSSATRFYQLQDLVTDNRAALDGGLRAPLTEDLAHVRPGVAVSRTFTALTVIATGYGIYQDLQDGESVAQATTSNVGGAVAGGIAGGVVTGAIIGATAGSAFPVVGTVVGGVVGAGVGAAVGIYTSGYIDGMFEGGIDAAAGAGWEALEDTGAAIGDAAGDAASTVGRGLKSAWNAVF